jgi:hypothetical protein
MAIIVKTAMAAELLKAIKNAIDNRTVDTWSYDKDGDFTHTPEQWANKAWLTPKIYQGELRFGIVGQNNTKLSTVLYGVYHGRFIEMLLTHFDQNFETALTTSQKTLPDNF